MRLLLDTHALIWWLAGDTALTAPARAAIGAGRNQVFVSAASAWEIATKHRLGRLPGAALLATEMADILADQDFAELAITVRHGQIAGALAGAHRDPFDRMLIAQALAENMTLVSNEAVFDGFGVARLW